MDKIRKSERLCLASGVGAWGILLLSLLLMSVLPNWLAYLLALLWILSALCGIVLACSLRFRLGKKKNGPARWGMISSVLMLWIQGVTVGLTLLQGTLEWDSGEAGITAIGISTGVAGLLVCLYIVLARIGQNRLEARQKEEEDARKREC